MSSASSLVSEAWQHLVRTSSSPVAASLCSRRSISISRVTRSLLAYFRASSVYSAAWPSLDAATTSLLPASNSCMASTEAAVNDQREIASTAMSSTGAFSLMFFAPIEPRQRRRQCSKRHCQPWWPSRSLITAAMWQQHWYRCIFFGTVSDYARSVVAGLSDCPRVRPILPSNSETESRKNLKAD